MDRPARRYLVLFPSVAIFVGIFIVPLAMFFVMSFWRLQSFQIEPDFSFHNYRATIDSYLEVALFTFMMAGIIAILTTLIAFGFAYVIRFKAGRFAPVLLFSAVLTLFGGYLVKVYAWKTILGISGILNTTLLSLGIIDEPMTFLLFNPGSVVVTLTHYLLPLAVLPIYGSLRGIEDVTIEAARDLGARPHRVFTDVILPQSRAGLFAAFAFAFLISAGDYVTPRLVGGPDTTMMGSYIESVFGFRFRLAARCRHVIFDLGQLHHDSGAGQSGAAPRYTSMRALSTWFWRSFGLFVLVFMLSPLLLVVLFAFANSSVTNFPMEGVSFVWFEQLASEPEFWGAFQNSMIVAVSVGFISTVVGTMAAMALSRMRERIAAPAMMALAAPVMVPPLMVGLALLVFYVQIGLTLSVLTVILSHLVSPSRLSSSSSMHACLASTIRSSTVPATSAHHRSRPFSRSRCRSSGRP